MEEKLQQQLEIENIVRNTKKKYLIFVKFIDGV